MSQKGQGERRDLVEGISCSHFISSRNTLLSTYYVPDMMYSSRSRVVNKRSTDSWREPSGYEDKHQANKQSKKCIMTVSDKCHERN